MIIETIRVRAVHAEPTRDRRTRLAELLGFRLPRVPHVALLGEGAAPAHVVDANFTGFGHVDLLRRLRRVSIDTAFSCARRAVPVRENFSAACCWHVDGVLVSRRWRAGWVERTSSLATVDVRIQIIFAVISATPWGHWHIGISCFLPRGMVIQLSVCSNMPAFRHRSPA